jgi:putative MATE family efflux protein
MKGRIEMANSYTKTDLFEKAPVHQAFFSLALPSVFGKIIMVLYNLADTWFIARTGDTNIVAGVSLVSPVFMVMVALGDIFGVGGSSVVSRLMGNRKKEDSRRISALCFYGALLLGVLVAAVLLILKNPLLTILGTDSATLPHAANYYTYIALGAPLLLAGNVPLNLLRTEGMAKASMAGSIVGSVVNMILDPIFILEFQMGAAGAAIATVIGNAASLIAYSLFYRKAEWITISLKYLQFSWNDIKNVASVGLPSAFNNLMTSFTTAITNRLLVSYGNDAVAAWSLAGRCTMISTMLFVSFSFSSLPLIGYNYGQKNYERLKKILKFIYSFEISLAVGVGILMAIFAPNLIALFMEDAAIVSAGTQILRCQLSGVVFTAIILISTCVFQAIGNGKATLAVTVGRQLVIFVPVLFAANYFVGYRGILFAQPLSDLLSVVLIAILLKRNKKSILGDA